MALSVTGTDDNGRITPRANTNIIIPPENAGIGDLIFKNATVGFKVIGRGTASGASITLKISGTDYTFTLWGSIFGFVAGMAMVVAPNGAEAGSLKWAPGGSVPSWLNKYYGAGTTLMRNGNKTPDYYAQMNTSKQMESDSYRGTAGTSLHPTQAYNGGVMTESSYNSNTNNVKRFYGSWREYLRQTLRVNGAPGTCFGAVFDGCKVHEYGRYITNRIGSESNYATNYPAVAHCYDYQGALGSDPKGTWWLPSMFELGELMIDEHLNKVNENSAILSVSAGLDRWSCVPFSSTLAWLYYGLGMSRSYGVTGAGSDLVARPVTLLKLVN